MAAGGVPDRVEYVEADAVVAQFTPGNGLERVAIVPSLWPLMTPSQVRPHAVRHVPDAQVDAEPVGVL